MRIKVVAWKLQGTYTKDVIRIATYINEELWSTSDFSTSRAASDWYSALEAHYAPKIIPMHLLGDY